MNAYANTRCKMPIYTQLASVSSLPVKLFCITYALIISVEIYLHFDDIIGRDNVEFLFFSNAACMLVAEKNRTIKYSNELE